MQAREYRTPWGVIVLGIVVLGALSLSGLLSVISFAVDFEGAGDAITLLSGVMMFLVGSGGLVEMIGGRKLLVTGDGLHGFRNMRPMVIPWPAVRSISATRPPGRQIGWVVSVDLDNGKRVPLATTAGSRRRADRIAGELSAALAEYREATAPRHQGNRYPWMRWVRRARDGKRHAPRSK
jgi:hypothetical protein